MVEESELARVFPPVVTDEANGETRLVDKDAVIEDLRHRLDEAHAERRQTADRLAAAQERIAALLTDQRTAPAVPRRPWWPWKRRA